MSISTVLGLAMLSGIRQCGFTPWIVLDNVPAEMSENPTQNRTAECRRAWLAPIPLK